MAKSLNLENVRFVSPEEIGNMPVSEGMNAIRLNVQTAERLRTFIAQLQKRNSNRQRSEKDTVPEQKVPITHVAPSRDLRFDALYEKYLAKYKKMTEVDLEDVSKVLPPKNEYRYLDILNRLKMYSLMQIKEIKKAIKEFGEDEDLLREKELEYAKIAAVMDYTFETEVEEEVENDSFGEENSMVLVPNENGAIQVLEDMEKIDSEYYPDFFKLFKSIINGTFKNYKRFTTTDAIRCGFSEIKGWKVRVFFRQLGKNQYAIISAFVKKADKTASIENRLRRMVRMYNSDKVQGILSNQEFLSQADNNTMELWNILSRNNAVASEMEKNPTLVKRHQGGDAQ